MRRIAQCPVKADALRDATRSQRQALAAATEAAIAVLGDDATEAYRTQIAATLQAASVDEETAEGLQKGRLTREVSGSTRLPRCRLVVHRTGAEVDARVTLPEIGG